MPIALSLLLVLFFLLMNAFFVAAEFSLVRVRKSQVEILVDEGRKGAKYTKLVADNGQVQFIQNASNGATAEWNAQLQLLVSGNATGASMVKAVQAKYEDEVR